MSLTATSPAASPRSGAGGRLPGLDGLRGVAVVWVLAFHLWPDALRGGWLGVGLFFTLSGYLIAGLLDAEMTSTGRLRLGRFMARRARRLLPAALVTIAATLALTAVVDDQPLRIIGVDALTAALNVFNWHASLDETGYAGIFAAAPEPLAHFWSLAIEEQFYLVFPAAVALTRRPGRVVVAMAAIGLVGVGLWWGSTDAYVATPVRALEIAAGAGLAVAQARCAPIRRLFQPPGDWRRLGRIAWGVTLAAAAALTAVSVARLGPADSVVFRGGPQLMALCWVVLVVAAVRDGWPARLMSWPVLRWLGLRSYAIYLFHWPVIELTDWHPAAVIAVTLGAAEVSFRALEMPVRRGAGPRAIPVLAAAAVAVVAVAGVAAAASSPARGIAQRAEGADELPAWLTEEPASSDEPEAAPPSSSPGAAPDSEPDTATGSEPASSSLAAAPSGTAAASAEPDGATEPPGQPADPLSSGIPDESPVPSEGSADGSEASVSESSQPTGSDPPTESSPDTPEAVDSGSGLVTSPSQPAVRTAVPIVTVIGDSTAVYIADGLRRWADATRTMAVVDHSRIGCSPAAFAGSAWRASRGNVGDEAHPSGFSADIPCRDDYIEPGASLVLVVDHGAVLFDHLRADGTWASILDADLSSDVADSYRRLADEALAQGASVVFTTAPTLLLFGEDETAQQPQTDPERAEAYNALIAELSSELDGVEGGGAVALIETAAAIDASGYDGRYGRSDGMHVDYERAEAFAAELLGPALLAFLGAQ